MFLLTFKHFTCQPDKSIYLPDINSSTRGKIQEFLFMFDFSASVTLEQIFGMKTKVRPSLHFRAWLRSIPSSFFKRWRMSRMNLLVVILFIICICLFIRFFRSRELKIIFSLRKVKCIAWKKSRFSCRINI